MASPTTLRPPSAGARVQVQKFGTFLSSMVMPNIGAFIAWGLITALFIQVGWLPKLGIGDSPDSWVARIGGWDADGGGIVGPMITYLLPILIGYTGGRMIHQTRGGVVGAISQMAMTRSLQLAPIATVVPFDYTQLIWATMLGWLIWSAVPGLSTLAGAGLIIAGGLYTVWREHRLLHNGAPAPR